MENSVSAMPGWMQVISSGLPMTRGIAAARAARKADKDADVVVATEEFAAPYLRPSLAGRLDVRA